MLGFENLATFKHFVEKLKDILATISYVDELDANNLKKTGTYDLVTSDKTVIGSLNEIGYHVINNTLNIGDPTALTTNNKENLVSSINEVNTVIDIDYDALMQSINEIDASLPDNT